MRITPTLAIVGTLASIDTPRLPLRPARVDSRVADLALPARRWSDARARPAAIADGTLAVRAAARCADG